MLIQQQLANYKLVLASNSPRRKLLLAGLDIDFEIWSNNDNPETYPQNINIEEIPSYLAKQKAEAFKHQITSEHIVITSDTIVCCNGKVLGKPANKTEAKLMLGMLSGNLHTVITGVALTSAQKQTVFDARTKVFFKQITQEEVDYYVEKYCPLDKAGAYGIQEWIGYVGIERIEGSYFNVMGLPIQKLYTELNKFVSK